MTEDAENMRRIQSAALRVLNARAYRAYVEQWVRDAEASLEAAIDAAAPLKQARKRRDA